MGLPKKKHLKNALVAMPEKNLKKTAFFNNAQLMNLPSWLLLHLIVLNAPYLQMRDFYSIYYKLTIIF